MYDCTEGEQGAGTVTKMTSCQVRTGAPITPLQPHSRFISVHCGAACHYSVKKERARDRQFLPSQLSQVHFVSAKNP